MSKDIIDEVFPIYTSKGIEYKKVSVIIDDNGHVTHVKTEDDDDYKPLLILSVSNSCTFAAWDTRNKSNKELKDCKFIPPNINVFGIYNSCGKIFGE